MVDPDNSFQNPQTVVVDCLPDSNSVKYTIKYSLREAI